MSFLTKSVITVSILFGASLAQADQCSYVSKEYAQKAMNVLNAHVDTETKIVSWCQPCGQARPAAGTEGQKIQSVKISHTGYEDYYQIHINGLSVDMAYTYIAGINLAKYINANSSNGSETPSKACDLQGVSDEL